MKITQANQPETLAPSKGQLDLEDFRAYAQREHELWIAGAKALMLLHGAGVAAMLGFMQALVGKQTLGDFKAFGCTALVIYLLGSLSGLLVLRRRTEFSFAMARDLPSAAAEGDGALISTKVGVALFMIASVIAVVGIALKL